jgi:hypothetical protein
MLLAGSAGLVGAAAVAARPALAQGSPPASVLPIQAPARQDWLDKRHEEIIEPGLPIIDPHHHLWDRPGYRYLFPELLADVGSGHNIRATCYEQAREMYRADGPDELKSLGETEFVSGVSAMSASGKMDRRGASPASSASSIYGSARALRASSSVTSRFPTAACAASATARPGATTRRLRPSRLAGPQGCYWTRAFAKGLRTSPLWASLSTAGCSKPS